jgi:hypothetical protein
MSAKRRTDGHADGQVYIIDMLVCETDFSHKDIRYLCPMYPDIQWQKNKKFNEGAVRILLRVDFEF